MRPQEMGDVIPVIRVKAPSGREAAERPKIRAAVAARLGSDLGTTEAAEAWAMEALAPLTLATMSDPVAAVAVATTAVAEAVRIAFHPAHSAAAAAVAAPVSHRPGLLAPLAIPQAMAPS